MFLRYSKDKSINLASIYLCIFFMKTEYCKYFLARYDDVDGNNKFDTRENNWLGCFSRKFCASFRIFAFSNLALQQKPVTRVIGRYTIA